MVQQSAAAAPVAADDNLKTILKEIRIQLFNLRKVLNCKDNFENLFPRNSAASNFLLNTVQESSNETFKADIFNLLGIDIVKGRAAACRTIQLRAAQWENNGYIAQMDNISFEAVRNLMCRYAIGGYSLRQGLNSIDEIWLHVSLSRTGVRRFERKKKLEVVGQKGNDICRQSV